MNQNNTIWQLQPWLLAGILAVASLLFHTLIDDNSFEFDSFDRPRATLATFVLVASMSFVFVLEKNRYIYEALFSLFCGMVMAGISYWAISSDGVRYQIDFSLWMGFIAVAVAVPLYQTIRHHSDYRLPYAQLHDYAWNDVVCWFAAYFFFGVSFLLAHLLSSLFQLIGLVFLKQLLNESWFLWMLAGASFGCALGVLKQNRRIVSNLQNLVMTVLSVLAVPLCVGLIVFLLSLPFTGLQPLWDATKSTTPILLSCALGAVILANAVIGNHKDEESSNKIQQISSIGLLVCVLPLALISGISMQIRVVQYGITPDRIWGLIAMLIVAAYGIAYLCSVAIRRKSWMANVRRNNTRLAVGLLVTAFFLALPILDFGGISVKSQLARLDDGRTTAKEFDYAAMAFDFGPKGRAALKVIERSENEVMVNGAKLALSGDRRWDVVRTLNKTKVSQFIENSLRVFPVQIDVPQDLANIIKNQGACFGTPCLLIWDKDSVSAELVTSSCTGMYNQEERPIQECEPVMIPLRKVNGDWNRLDVRRRYPNTFAKGEDERLEFWKAFERGEIKIKKVERNLLIIGGEIIGSAFE